MIHNVFDKELFFIYSDPKTLHFLSDCSYISSGIDGNVYRFSKNLVLKLFYPNIDIKYTPLKANKFRTLSDIGLEHYQFPKDLVFNDIGNFAGEVSKYLNHNEDEFFKITPCDFLQNIEEIKLETKRILNKGIIPNDVGFHNMLYQNNMKLIDPARFILNSSLSTKEKKKLEDQILNNLLFSIMYESLRKAGVPNSSAGLYAYEIEDYIKYFEKYFKEDSFDLFLEKEKEKIIRY